jgi:hypothetical protein
VAALCEEALCVYPVAGGGPQVLSDSAKLAPVGWLANDVLIARDFGKTAARLFRFDLATGARTDWMDLVPHDRSGVRRINSVSISADGRAYAYSYTRQVSDLYAVTGLR